MQRIKHFLSIVLIVGLFFNCKTDQANHDEDMVTEVLVFLIEAKAIPLPSPPKPSNKSSSDWQISQHVIDSLKKVNLRVAIYPELTKPNVSLKFNQLNIPKGYNEIIRQFHSLAKRKNIPIKSINQNSRHEVFLADTLILNNSKDWKDFDILFQFSNIAFNKSFDKAAFTVGISQSSLSGYGNLYLLEKDKDGRWNINRSFPLEIW